MRGATFESLVNTEGFQTGQRNGKLRRKFESLVNTEGFQTAPSGVLQRTGV